MNRRNFTSSVLALTGCALTPRAAAGPVPLKAPRDWRVLFNDDASNNLTGAVYPLTRAELEARVDFLVERGIDAYAWCTCLPDLCWYGTKVGESLLSPDRQEKLHSASVWFMVQNLKSLVEAGNDPIRVLAERCHYHGVPFLASVRMNDSHHSNYESAWTASRFFLEHPEWQIRDAQGRALGGMDYAVTEVRAHRLKILQEQADHFEIDGLELDWMRLPPFFRPDRAVENITILTSYVREIREMLDRAAAKRGRDRLLLGLRIPATLRECHGLGIDVAEMIREGGVDYICPTDFIRPDFNIPVETFRELTKGNACGVFPSIFPGGVSRGYYRVLNIEQYRAIANNFYEGGAHGISTFNIMPGYIKDPTYRRLLDDAFAMISQVKVPKQLKNQDRHYVFYPLHEGRSPTGKVIDRRIQLDRSQDVGLRKTLRFRVMENFADTRWRYTFRFLASNLTPEDHVTFDLNGKSASGLLRTAVRPGGRSEYHWVLGLPSPGSLHEYEMELDANVAQRGDNELGATLVKANTALKEWSANYLGPVHTMEVDPIVILELEVRVTRRGKTAA